MNLYLEIENGQPKNHPSFEDNVLETFGEIPANWEPFVRVDSPVFGVYETLEFFQSTYAKVDGVWTDVWTVRNMTTEEKLAKQQHVRDIFNSHPQSENWSAWIFDEETCSFKPPIPRPIDGNQYYWQGTTLSWVLKPTYPDDGKKYNFDFFSGVWVEIT